VRVLSHRKNVCLSVRLSQSIVMYRNRETCR